MTTKIKILLVCIAFVLHNADAAGSTKSSKQEMASKTADELYSYMEEQTGSTKKQSELLAKKFVLKQVRIGDLPKQIHNEKEKHIYDRSDFFCIPDILVAEKVINPLKYNVQIKSLFLNFAKLPQGNSNEAKRIRQVFLDYIKKSKALERFEYKNANREDRYDFITAAMQRKITIVGARSDPIKLMSIYDEYNIHPNDVVHIHFNDKPAQSAGKPLKSPRRFIHRTVTNYGTIENVESIGESTVIRKGAIVKDWCVIGALGNIEIDSIIEKHSTVGADLIIGKRACIHPYARIFLNVTEGAVIHPHVHLPKNNGSNRWLIMSVGAILMRSPTSKELYVLTASPDDIYRRDILYIAEKQTQGISEEFNEMLENLIDQQFEALIRECNGNNNLPEMELFPIILTLYMLKYDGIKSFASSRKTAKAPLKFRDRRSENVPEFHRRKRELMSELHFDKTSKKFILNPRVQKKFIQLLAIYMDRERTTRTKGDTFCKMLKEILHIDGIKREVICVTRDVKPELFNPDEYATWFQSIPSTEVHAFYFPDFID